MVLGRNLQRDLRRRRALVDDRRERPAPPVGPAFDRPARRYTPAVDRERQLRVVDLVPLRPWTLLIWHLTLALVLVSHAAAASWEYRARHAHWTLDLSCLQLGQSPSLRSWTAAISLLAAAAFAAVILRFRRHKTDDYRGRYRIWYPTIGCLLIGATTVGSGLSRPAASALRWGLESIGLSREPTWFGGILVIFIALVATRMCVEVWVSRAATSNLIAAAICAALLHLLPGSLLPGSSNFPQELRTAAQGLLSLASALLVLLTAVSYARFVRLDAQGLIVAATTEGKPTSRVSEAEPITTASGLLTRFSAWRTERRARAAQRREQQREAKAAKTAARQEALAAKVRSNDPPADSEQVGATTKSAEPKGTQTRRPQPSRPAPAVESHSPKPSDSTASAARDERETDAETEPSGDPADSDKLSRAERRRLRKEKKRQRRAA